MKKSLIFSLLLVLSFSIACEKEDDPTPTTGTINVTVHYTGSNTVDSTHKLFIAASTGTDWTTALRIPSKITSGTYGSDFLAESSTDDSLLTLTLDPGTYYIVAAYDVDADMTKSYIFNAGTEYVIYNDKAIGDTANFTAIVLEAGDVQSFEMTIDGSKTVL